MFIWRSRNSPHNKDFCLIFDKYQLCHKVEWDVMYKIIWKINGFRKMVSNIRHQTMLIRQVSWTWHDNKMALLLQLFNPIRHWHNQIPFLTVWATIIILWLWSHNPLSLGSPCCHISLYIKKILERLHGIITPFSPGQTALAITAKKISLGKWCSVVWRSWQWVL